MIQINVKNALIATGVAVAAAAVTVGTIAWFTRDQWSEAAACAATSDMNDAYNRAIAEWPSNRDKASFAFEQAAAEIKKAFVEKYGKFDEYNAWASQYDQRVKSCVAAIRHPDRQAA